MEFDKEAFRKMFPNLAKELESGRSRATISSVRTDVRVAEDASSNMFVSYTPDVVDFIRRCDTEEQAEEIITYMERRGEISREYAERLRKQLKDKGVRSFGPKKESNYYLKRAGFR